MRNSHLLLGLTLLCPTLSAQEIEPEAPPPWFRAITRDPAFSMTLAAMLGAEPQAFELQGRECIQIQIDPDGSVLQRKLPAGGHPDGWAEFFIRSVDVLPDARKQHEKEIARFALQADVALQAAGYPRGFGEELVDQVLDLISTFTGFYIRIEGDPRQPAKGVTVFLDTVPEPETDLYDYVKALSPNFRGAPPPPDEQPMASFRVSLNQDFLFQLLAPFADLACKRGAKTDEELERNRDWYDRALETFDGTYSGSFDGELLIGYLGLRDPKAHAAMLQDAKYLDWVREQTELSPGLEAEIEPRGLEHRDVVMVKTTLHSEIPNPLMPGGKNVSYRGVAGGYELTVAGADVTEDTVKKAIDRLLDDPPERGELPDSGIFVADLDLGRILGLLPEEIRDKLFPPDSLPRTARLLFHKIGITVKLRLELR